jgi:hypothetical protein
MLGLIFARSPIAIQRLTAIGREYESQGHYRRAEWIFRRVVRLGPPSSTAYFDLGRILTRRGKLDDAKRNYALSLELKPDFYLCRINFFETCRQEYWTFNAPALAQIEQQLTTDEATPELHLRRLHLLLSGGLFQQMRFEVARLDYDDLDTSVYDRLFASQHAMKGSARAQRRLATLLAQTQGLFERLEAELATIRGLFPGAETRRVRLLLRKKPPIDLVGLRDSDDLIGYHLEVISGGKLSFLGWDRIRRVDLGLHSEFIEASLELTDAAQLKVVVPSIYYGSQQSTLPELQRGEFTIFKDLYRGIQLGVGRRVFSGRNAENGEPVAVGIHEVRAIEFP